MTKYKTTLIILLAWGLILFNLYVIIEDKAIASFKYSSYQFFALGIFILLLAIPEKENNSKIDILKSKVEKLEYRLNLTSSWVIKESEKNGVEENHQM